jgi:hypothetical protein
MEVSTSSDTLACGHLIFTLISYLDCAAKVFHKDYDYLLDPSWKAKVHDCPAIASEKEKYLIEGIPKARRQELHKAMDIVMKARIVFQSCQPHLPANHNHFVVVKLSVLAEKLRSPGLQNRFKLSPEDVDGIISRLDRNSLPAMVSVRRSAMFPSPKHQSIFSPTNGKPNPFTIPEGDEAEDLQSDEPSELTELASSHPDATRAADNSLERPAGTESLQTPVTGNSHGSNSTASTKERVMDMLSYMNPLNFLVKKKREDTDISFSMFVQSLQDFASEKFLPQPQRRSAVSVMKRAEGSLRSEDFYLN